MIIVNIVIHTASSLVPALALNLLAGLAEQQKASGSKAYFIHVSYSLFTCKAWASHWYGTNLIVDFGIECILCGDRLATRRHERFWSSLRDREAIGGFLLPPEGKMTLSQTTCAETDFPKTDVTITETAKKLGITSYIVVPSTVCRDPSKTALRISHLD